MYTLILNPGSGRGKAIKCLPEIEKVLQENGCEYQTIQADTPEDATRLAREAAAEGVQGVIAVGGDGTLFQICNGLAGCEVPMLFVSCGTGNDFVKALKLPKDPIEALKLQLKSPVSRIDVGRMNEQYFLNVAGTGFDVDVLRHVETYKQKYSGIIPYLMALVKAVKGYRPTVATVSIDGAPEETMSFAIISIGNGSYIGGGMNAVPGARLDDGLFDVVMVKPVPRWAILFLIPFYIAGKHIDMKLAVRRACKKITLKCPGMTLNLDGELRSADYAAFELHESALKVQIPKA